MKVKTKIIWTVVFSVMLVLLIVLLALTSDTILRWHNFYIEVKNNNGMTPYLEDQYSEHLNYFTYWIVIICFAVFMLCLIYGLWHKNIVTAVRMKKYNTVKIEQIKKEKKKKELQVKYEKLKKEMEHCE